MLTVLGMFSLTSGMGEVWGLSSGQFAVPLECVGFLKAARQSSLEVDVAVAEVPVDPRKALSIQRRRSTLNSCMGPEAPRRLGAGPASAQGTAAGRRHQMKLPALLGVVAKHNFTFAGLHLPPFPPPLLWI